jgi:hypothetical protein
VVQTGQVEIVRHRSRSCEKSFEALHVTPGLGLGNGLATTPQQAIYHSWQSSVYKKIIVIMEDFYDGNRAAQSTKRQVSQI